ncbi:MAG: class I SAM-dependent methyltransferase [Bacteroidetes bacterium]|nr:class I SAM-dependent methyltransferase [Bacteroidota bacterium]MDA0938627.1 class I SAM-dependent methyltransferase [Bacteroidota bacterium]MDA1345129.1 class I SAM-dependent methyltransferase [Bacteroidota bacterium]
MKSHWETIYNTKTPEQVSWTQELPITSLEFIQNLNLSKESPIIDVGGGDSKLVDHLLDLGYQNITVLDISEAALNRSKKRLGLRANKVQWIVSDVLDFVPKQSYALWHDRAAFHFLTTENEIEKYLSIISKVVKQAVVIGTFSTNGPTKCSGLEIQQYNSDLMENLFKTIDFFKVNCRTENHTTPSGGSQNFLFCSFQKPTRQA